MCESSQTGLLVSHIADSALDGEPGNGEKTPSGPIAQVVLADGGEGSYGDCLMAVVGSASGIPIMPSVTVRSRAVVLVG